MEAFDMHELVAAEPADQHTYRELMRSELLSLGLAVWPAGSTDDQQPHTEDEIYYVVEGRGRIQVGGEDRSIKPGSVIFVATGVEHHFHDIEEDMKVLVFWAPPRHSRR